MTIIQEGERTIEARRKLIQALKGQGFSIDEEKKFYCTNSKAADQYKYYIPYSADIYVSIGFIIELDPLSSHKSTQKKHNDDFRDSNIWQQEGVKTVRLDPSDLLKDGGIELAGKEIVSQLQAEKYQK